MKDKSVYIAMATDVLHAGHIAVIQEGMKYGEVIVGVLTDEAIAAYKRVPVLSYEQRKTLFESIRGVSRVIPQTSLDYTQNLFQLRPDYVVHGDDWRCGVQSKVREAVIRTLQAWGGKLIEVPYMTELSESCEGTIYKAIRNTPDYRRALLKKMLRLKPYIRVMEASNGLSGLIVENLKLEEEEKGRVREFDAIWLSSLCDSTSKGKPDNELVDLTSRIHTVNEIMEVTTKPLLFDGDTGGQAEHFAYNIKTLERLGVSAIVIEDKKGLKRNSLLGTEVVQELEDMDIFCEKIRIGKKAQITKDFMIFARIESLIAGFPMEEALKRAFAYVEAGADGIMIHSKEADGGEVFAFMRQFQERFAQVPVILVPTTYNQYTEEELHLRGAKIIIYANHLLRSAYPAMVKTARTILEDGNSKRASQEYCMPIKEVIHLINGGGNSDKYKKFL